MEILIDTADKASVGDMIIVPVYNPDDYDRDIHYIGRVLFINLEVHPDIIEFTVKLFAHCDGKVGSFVAGIQPLRKIGIIRG